MRSFEQREFMPLFQRDGGRTTRSEMAEPAAEMSQQILRLARSVESLTRALSRVSPPGLPFDQPGCTTLVSTIAAGHAPDLDE